MRAGTRTASVLAVLAAACAWWAAAGDGGAVPAPTLRELPSEPRSHRPPLAPIPEAESPRSGTDELDLLAALLPPEEGKAPPEGKPRGYVRSGYREMPEKLRSELREAARLELEPLLEKFRAAEPGPERARILQKMMGPLNRFMATGGGFEHLALLGECAENGVTREERKRAVIATHTLWQPEVIDWLEERAKSPHDEVRFYAVEGFAWTEGEERPRALENLVRGLEDPAYEVRAIAALSMGTVVADPARIPDLVARLGREEHPRVVQTIVWAILRLDPEHGADRVRSAAPGASGEAWAAAEEALKK